MRKSPDFGLAGIADALCRAAGDGAAWAAKEEKHERFLTKGGDLPGAGGLPVQGTPADHLRGDRGQTGAAWKEASDVCDAGRRHAGEQARTANCRTRRWSGSRLAGQVELVKTSLIWSRGGTRDRMRSIASSEPGGRG